MKPLDITIACSICVTIVCAVLWVGGCYSPSEAEKQSFWLKQIAGSEMRQADALERIADRVAPKAASRLEEQ